MQQLGNHYTSRKAETKRETAHPNAQHYNDTIKLEEIEL